MLSNLPGILGSLIVFVSSLVALEKIRTKEICRRREERLRAWILKVSRRSRLIHPKGEA